MTPEVETACNRLADSGIPLGSQTVLLKGVNDNSKTLKILFQKLLKMRVKPYYLYQTDLTVGTSHFRTTVEKGLKIIQDLAGHTTGMAVPYYVIDAPGGGGKVRLLPNSMIEQNDREIVIQNFEGKLFHYPLPLEKSNGKQRANVEPGSNLPPSHSPLCSPTI